MNMQKMWIKSPNILLYCKADKQMFEDLPPDNDNELAALNEKQIAKLFLALEKNIKAANRLEFIMLDGDLGINLIYDQSFGFEI